MDGRSDRPIQDPVGEAIAEVLRAEQAALLAIDEARNEAALIVDAAHDRAKRLTERTERRIRSLVIAFDRDLAQRLAEIEAQSAAFNVPKPLTEVDVKTLDKTLREAVRAMIGAPRD
jgi:vacuolar-type H+-ATPase subunit H